MADNCTIYLHLETDPYARVRKEMLQSNSLSWKAKGILSYLLGKPQGWRLMTADIVNRSNEGEASVRAGLNELRNAGYIKLVQQRADGKIVHWTYHIADKPVFLESGSQDVEKLDVDFLHVENRHHSNKESNKIESNNESQLLLADSPKPKKSKTDFPPEAMFWNENCGTLPKVMSFPANRQKKLAQRRLDSFWVENFEKAVIKISQSSFCLGVSDRGWRASFDWLIERPDALAKVMEGKYDNRSGSTYGKTYQQTRNSGIVEHQAGSSGLSKAERVLARRREQEGASVRNGVAAEVVGSGNHTS